MVVDWLALAMEEAMDMATPVGLLATGTAEAMGMVMVAAAAQEKVVAVKDSVEAAKEVVSVAEA